MEPPPRCVVNDGLCHDMAKAWPDVEELCYAHMSWCTQEPRFNMATVEALDLVFCGTLSEPPHS